MKVGNIPCVNDEQTQIGIRLCEAVKLHPCLYDPLSQGYQVRNATSAAWKIVAKKCSDSAANCKFRWKIIRNAFTRSYRKYGNNSQYYLQDHLDFLIPHTGVVDRNDDSTLQPDENSVSQQEGEKNDDYVPIGELFNDSDTTKSAEECAANLRTQDLLTPLRRKSVPLPIIEKEDNAANDDCVMLRSPSPALPEIQAHLRANEELLELRPSRTRKAPKRIYELDTDAPETQAEKRQKRLMQRRKSIGGLVLREYMQKNIINLDEPDEEPEMRKPKPLDKTRKSVENLLGILKEPKMPKPVNETGKSYENLLESKLPEPKQSEPKQPEPKLPEPRIPTILVRSFAKAPTTSDISTNTDFAGNETAEMGIQCNTNVVEPMDEAFLESLRPQIRNMNFRQKINFKQRVYLALMEVLDDAKNFPNDEGEVVELPPTLAQHFESTSSGEIRLMRQLVSLVQAAKTSSEIVNATNQVPVVTDLSSTTNEQNGNKGANSPITIELDSPMTIEFPTPIKEVNTPSQNQTTPSQITSTKSNDSMGIPRHILHRAVQVTGNGGGTLLAHSGDKKRIYRIYPKNPAGASLTNIGDRITNTQGSTGTFFVTPSKPPSKPVVPLASRGISPVSVPKAPAPIPKPPAPVTISKPLAPAPPPIIRGTAIQYPKIIKTTNPTTSTTQSPMLPPNSNKSPVLSNGASGTPPPSSATKFNLTTHVPSANIFRRRYSICGPALSGTAGGTTLTQNRPSQLNSKMFTPPLPVGQKIQLQRTPLQQQQHLQQQKLLLQNNLRLKQQHARIQLMGGILAQQRSHLQLQQKQTTQLNGCNNYHSNTTNSNSPIQQFHISQPVSLNSAATAASSDPLAVASTSGSKCSDGSISCSKLFDILDSPRGSPTVSPRPSPSSSPYNATLEEMLQDELNPVITPDIPVLETAGTIAADSFESEFAKAPAIKSEPDE
ncbi:mucin-2 [Stomoxys calcitrans]|uniref:mucin-2 n=1 Tax=Stomoxys calcitrans TaxID=35570 RepID=UPI0027E25207|nr:mucin-2 [Stomoxys calcitrans]